jgi:hypothetical protein
MDFKKFLKYVPALALSLVVLLAGIILYFIYIYGIDVPYMDQWEYVVFFDHLSKGTLTFAELFKLQGEYRQFFPNLIFVSLGWLTNWNVRYEMLVIFLLACLVSFNVYRLASLTITDKNWLKWLLFFLANLFIFSPWQYENWLFGVQIEYFMPIACVTTAMVIAFSRLEAPGKLVLCIVFSIISTYSSINGFICWIVLFPVFYLSGTDSKFFKKWNIVLIWVLGTLITLWYYFNGYKSPANFPSTLEVLNHPVDALRYFAGVLGNPIRIVHSLDHIIAVGGVVIVVFTGLVLYIIWHSKDKHLVKISVVWIMLAFYSILTAAMITVGRLGFGVYQSLSSRYTTFSSYLIVATIFLAAIVIQHIAKRMKYSIIQKVAIAVLVGYIIYIKVDTYPVAVTDLKNFHSLIQHEKAGLLFINYIPHSECVNKIYPANFKELKRRANVLNSLGYLRPSLIKTNIIQDIEGTGSGTVNYGSLDNLIGLSDSIFTASGTAVVPNTDGPADAILLTYQNLEGKSLLLALDNSDSINWKKTFSVTKIPFDTITINAWTFDGNTGKAYRLKGSKTIYKVKQ